MLSQNENLKPGELYLYQLIAFQDTEPVKVVTGMNPQVWQIQFVETDADASR